MAISPEISVPGFEPLELELNANLFGEEKASNDKELPSKSEIASVMKIKF